MHYFFLGCSVCFMVGCAAEESLQPWIGSSGNLGLMLTALSFGSGFLTKADFSAMPWDVLMILFGVNVTAFTLKESGLALSLATNLIPQQVYNVSLWWELAKISGASLLVSTITGQTVFATLAIPIVAALGAKLYCPLLTCLLATLAIHCGVFLPHSSTDLILTFDMATDTTTETKEDKGDRRKLLDRADFLKVGLVVGLIGWLITISLGYSCGIGLLGTPPQPIIIHEPTELVPTAVWLGNGTSLEDEVKILKELMEGEAIVNNTWEGVRREHKIRPMGTGRGGNITIGHVEAPHPVKAQKIVRDQQAIEPLQHLVGWVHHRGHRRGRIIRRRLRHHQIPT